RQQTKAGHSNGNGLLSFIYPFIIAQLVQEKGGSVNTARSKIGAFAQPGCWGPRLNALGAASSRLDGRTRYSGTSPVPLDFYWDPFSFAMKLRDRFRQLQDPAVVKAMVVRSVYASMALENQTVSLDRLEALYEQTGPMLPAGATGR
ncbi:hypothetical protein HBN54_004646, partial [Hymenobacter sp. 1B]